MRRSLLIPIVVIIAGCERTGPVGPPEVRYGQAECAHCGMIVSEERHAAAIVASMDGEQIDLIFDDLGCMIGYEADTKLPADARRYVHDFETRRWLSSDEARFLRDPEVHTPMGSSLIAFDAGTARAAGGLTYAEVGSIRRSTATSATAPTTSQAAGLPDASHP